LRSIRYHMDLIGCKKSIQRYRLWTIIVADMGMATSKRQKDVKVVAGLSHPSSPPRVADLIPAFDAWPEVAPRLATSEPDPVAAAPAPPPTPRGRVRGAPTPAVTLNPTPELLRAGAVALTRPAPATGAAPTEAGGSQAPGAALVPSRAAAVANPAPVASAALVPIDGPGPLPALGPDWFGDMRRDVLAGDTETRRALEQTMTEWERDLIDLDRLAAHKRILGEEVAALRAEFGILNQRRIEMIAAGDLVRARALERATAGSFKRYMTALQEYRFGSDHERRKMTIALANAQGVVVSTEG
jgi:hypothetical protein